MEFKSSKNISRRKFLKASAIAVTAVSGADAMASSSPQMPGAEKIAAGTAAGASSSGRVQGYSGPGGWLGAAPVIPDADISKTVDVDVLVLGGGHAGLLAALGASDNGARVAVVEKQNEQTMNGEMGRYGEDIGHVNSKWLIKRGYGPYDTGEIVAEFVKRSAGR